MRLADEPRPAAATAAGSEPGPAARALHVFVLWGFAVAQPLFELLGRHAQFLVAQDLRPAEIVALTLLLCFLFPALLVAVELAAGRAVPWAGRAIHRMSVALLAAAVFLLLLKKLESLPGSLLLAAALGLGAVAAWAYQRLPAARTYLSILAPAPLAFAGVFLFSSQASKLVWPAPRAAPAVAAGAGPSEAAPADLPPVVLVVFDELSLPTLMDETRRIDALRYPNFGALAGDSHWFRNATTTADTTVLAMPAILSGRYQGSGHRKVRLATAANYPQNLFTLLGDGGEMNVFESVTHLCPREICGSTELDLSPATRMRYLLGDLSAVYLHRLLPADQTAWLPPVNQQWGHFALFVQKKRKRAAWAESDRKVRYFSAFQAAVRADPGFEAGARLHFLHGDLPHVPWRYLPSGKSYGSWENGLMGRLDLRQGRWVRDRWPVLQGFQRYLLQLGLVDRLLGDLVRALEETGLYDRALVIVTADHGVSFQPGGLRRQADRRNFADVMSVPLFVKLPDQRRSVLSDRNVELVDVLPTIADVLGLGEPWPMDGVSVFSRTPERPEKHIFRAQGKRRGKLTVDLAAMDARYRTVERMVEDFGPSSDPLALYRIGPRSELFGRPLAELEIGAEPEHKVWLTMPEVYDRVDPASGFVPARVSGSIRPRQPGRGPMELAVAVGGTVWATTHTQRSETPRAAFSAIVPEQALAPGRNRVEVFVIAGTPDQPRLIPTLRAGN